MTREQASIVTDDLGAEQLALPQKSRDEQVAIAAYLKWMAETGGAVVSGEQTVQFWLEAEKEVDAEA